MPEENSAKSSTLSTACVDEDQDALAPLLVFLEALDEATALFVAHGALAYQNNALKALLSSEPEAAALLESARRFGLRCATVPFSIAHNRSSYVRTKDLRVVTVSAAYSVQAIPLPTGGKEHPHVLLLIRRAGIVFPSAASLRTKFRFTPRETEVALLLAKGASDTEVALVLGVSVHTARHHGEHVFAKIGIHSRKALALHLA